MNELALRLSEACHLGELQQVQAIVEEWRIKIGKRPSQIQLINAMQSAAEHGQGSVLLYLLQENDRVFDFRVPGAAVSGNHPDMLQVLLDRGWDIDGDIDGKNIELGGSLLSYVLLTTAVGG